jgi:predicted lipoprotein with Yx(FWY)xxD motif
MTRKQIATIASFGLLALVVAGCGSSGSGSSGSSAMPAAASSSSGPTVASSSTALGKIVVDGKGRTLYLFAKDTGNQSTCSGACASNWRPYTAASKPAAGGGVSASAISLVKRSDGAKQVTLGGHPLYYFVGDQSAGQLNGQGVDEFGAKWWAVAPSGTSVMVAAKSSGGSSGGSTTSSGGGGYSY